MAVSDGEYARLAAIVAMANTSAALQMFQEPPLPTAPSAIAVLQELPRPAAPSAIAVLEGPALPAARSATAVLDLTGDDEVIELDDLEVAGLVGSEPADAVIKAELGQTVKPEQMDEAMVGVAKMKCEIAGVAEVKAEVTKREKAEVAKVKAEVPVKKESLAEALKRRMKMEQPMKKPEPSSDAHPIPDSTEARRILDPETPPAKLKKSKLQDEGPDDGRSDLEREFGKLMKKHQSGWSANWMARALLKAGFAKDDIEVVILGNDLQIAGNWTGTRDITSKDRSACQWCGEVWSGHVQPRVDYALGCGNCDIAGRKVGARGEQAIWQLSDAEWASFLQASKQAMERRIARNKASADKAEKDKAEDPSLKRKRKSAE